MHRLNDNYPRHDMDAIMNIADPCIVERTNINGLRGINSSSIDQMLDAIEVDDL